MDNEHDEIAVVQGESKNIDNAAPNWMVNIYQTLRYIILGMLAVIIIIFQIASYIPFAKLSRILFKYYTKKPVRFRPKAGDSGARCHSGCDGMSF